MMQTQTLAQNTRTYFPDYQREISTGKKRIRHRVFDAVVSILENKQIKFRGKVLPYVLHPLTVKGLLDSGWTKKEVRDVESSIFRDVEDLRDAEMVRDVPASLYYQLKKQGFEDAIFEYRIIPIPSKTTNALICEELAKNFTESELLICGIFVKVRDIGIDEKPTEVWRIDIDETRARRGFIVPIIKNDLISELKVFRHFNDQKPFTLRARANFTDRTAKYGQ